MNPKWSMEGLPFRKKGKDVASASLLQPFAKGEEAEAHLTPTALVDAGSMAHVPVGPQSFLWIERLALRPRDRLPRYGVNPIWGS